MIGVGQVRNPLGSGQSHGNDPQWMGWFSSCTTGNQAWSWDIVLFFSKLNVNQRARFGKLPYCFGTNKTNNRDPSAAASSWNACVRWKRVNVRFKKFQTLSWNFWHSHPLHAFTEEWHLGLILCYAFHEAQELNLGLILFFIPRRVAWVLFFQKF
jgi:hypothetical protein